MRFIFAKKTGFCSGVRRAVSLAQRSILAKRRKKGNGDNRVYTLGPLIHNPQEVERLERMGIRAIASLEQIERGILIIPSHGLPQPVLKRLGKMELKLIDATCPFVSRAQLLAKSLHEKGYHVVIIGRKSHPEVSSLLSFACGEVSVVETPEDLEKVKTDKRIGLISQTTESMKVFEKISRRLKTRSKGLKVYNTICKETSERQKEAKGIAKKSDLVIVIGGKNSANTTTLHKICNKITRAFHVESPEELKPEWFIGKRVVGITTGTSTPDWVIREVIKKLPRNKPH